MPENPRIEELRRRVLADPASIAFAALAEEYRKAGRFEEAIDSCTAGLQRHPAYLSAHVTLGRALLEVGRYDEAQEELEHVLRVAPENLAAIRGLAEIHHRRGELPEVHEPLGEATPAAPAATVDAPDFAPVPVAPEGRIRVSYAAATPDDAPTVPATAPRDPALDDLEVFLGAIVAARAAASGRG